MDKVKQITLRIKKWQFVYLISAFAILFSYLLAVTCPMHRGAITEFHLLGMFFSGAAGVILFTLGTIEMWDNWDDKPRR